MAIEQILQADQSARANVAAARHEAARIRADAQRQAEMIAGAQKAQLAEDLEGQVQAILADAQSGVQRIGTETDAYLERLRVCKMERLDELVTRLVKKVTSP